MATLNDIAGAVGVSRSTVSRVLNNSNTLIPVGPETRQRILDVAHDLNYQPSVFARGLRTKRSRIIGLAIRDFTNPLWGPLLQGIADVTRTRGYHAILHNMADESEEKQSVEMLVGQVGVDGILIIGDFPGDESNVQRILKHCPIAVTVCRSLDPAVVPWINVDDRHGISTLMEYLYQLGHRRIAFVGLAQPPGFAARHAAYRDFVTQHHMPVIEHVVDLSGAADSRFPSEDSLVELGGAALHHVLDSCQPIEALVCACDPMALGALVASQKRGLLVPRDLSLVGFDDAPLARYCNPALTTIRHPVAEMGRAAANLVIDLAEGATRSSTDVIVFTPRLIVRGSTGPPRHDIATVVSCTATPEGR